MPHGHSLALGPKESGDYCNWMGLTPMEFLLEVTSTVRKRLGQGAPAPAIVNLISSCLSCYLGNQRACLLHIR